MEFLGVTEDQLSSLTKETLPLLLKSKVILLEGDVGAGKTTLLQNYAPLLGIQEVVSSPTFGYVNEYSGYESKVIYHFDLYRLSTADEIQDLDLDDYVRTDALIFIEWPELSLPYLDNYLRIVIKAENSGRSYYFYDNLSEGL